MIQSDIEKKYSRHNIKSWIRKDIDTNSDMFVDDIEKVDRHIEKCLSTYKSKATRYLKLTDIDTESIVLTVYASILTIGEGTIQAHATYIGQELSSSPVEAIQFGSELLALLEGDLFSIERTGPETLMIYPNYSPSQQVQDLIHCTQYTPPLISKPLPWVSNTDGGYHVHTSSVILGHHNHHNYQQDLETISTLQSISWSLVPALLTEPELMKEPNQKPNEILSDYRKRRKQHTSAVAQAKQVYSLMQEHGNKFYFTWKYDKRGRLYSQGHDINLQGSEYKKAIIELTNKKPVTGV